MRKLGWAVMAVLAVLIALYGGGVLSVPAMRPPFIRDRMSIVPFAVYGHLGASALALLIGPFQHNTWLRSHFLNVHRWSGRTYVIAVIVGGISGLVLATMSQGGLPAHLGFGFLAVLWIGTTVMAYVRIRAKDQSTHRRWMARSFALTFAAVTLRIYLPVSQALGISFDAAYPVISWIAWVPNLIVAELLIQRRRPPRVASLESRSAAAA